MFNLIIRVSRFAFIFIGIFFLYSIFRSNYYITKDYIKYKYNIKRQRALIISFHILSYVLLIYDDTKGFDFDILRFGLYSFFIIIIIFLVTSLVLKNSDLIIWNIIIFMITISVVILQVLDVELLNKQLMWIVIGFILSFMFILIPFRLNFIKKFSFVFAILGFLLIISPFIFGVERNGSYNWIEVYNYSFQPSEFVKFIYIFFLASSLDKNITFKNLIKVSIVSGVYVLILVLQKDLGTALIYFMIYISIIYVAYKNELLLIGGLGLASIASLIAYKLFPHIRTRITIWKNPFAYIDDKGYQIIQSLFAIGTFGFFGSGLTLGYERYIPVVTTDFIFAAICEEFGTLFGILLIIIYLVLFMRIIYTALYSYDSYYSFLLIGCGVVIVFQSFLIIGGVIKFIPLTGVTLPYISYGGSSLVSNLLLIGLVQRIYRSVEKYRGEINEE